MRSFKSVSLPSPYTLCISEWPHNSPWLRTHLVRVDIVNVGLAATSETTPIKDRTEQESDVSYLVWTNQRPIIRPHDLVWTNQRPVLSLLTNQRPVFLPLTHQKPVLPVTPVPVPIPPVACVQGTGQGVLVPLECVILRTPEHTMRCRLSWIIQDKIIPDVVSEIGIAVIVTSSRIISWHWNIFIFLLPFFDNRIPEQSLVFLFKIFFYFTWHINKVCRSVAVTTHVAHINWVGKLLVHQGNLQINF